MKEHVSFSEMVPVFFGHIFPHFFTFFHPSYRILECIFFFHLLNFPYAMLSRHCVAFRPFSLSMEPFFFSCVSPLFIFFYRAFKIGPGQFIWRKQGKERQRTKQVSCGNSFRFMFCRCLCTMAPLCAVRARARHLSREFLIIYLLFSLSMV